MNGLTQGSCTDRFLFQLIHLLVLEEKAAPVVVSLLRCHRTEKGTRGIRKRSVPS